VALTVAVIVAATGAVGCGSYAAAARLEDTFPTRESAAQAVLDAIWMRDSERLLRLAVTESEFQAVVWPRLPASRPEMGMPLSYLWSDMAGRNRAGVAEALQVHGRERLTLKAIDFAGPPTDYGAFRIHPKTSMTVSDERGRRATVRLFGSMIESGGRWKVYSFVVD
jgi:hypothetical protein